MVEKQEIHIYHHYPQNISYIPPLRYPGVGHSILPPPIVEPNGYYKPTYTTTGKVERYDSI